MLVADENGAHFVAVENFPKRVALGWVGVQTRADVKARRISRRVKENEFMFFLPVKSEVLLKPVALNRVYQIIDRF